MYVVTNFTSECRGFLCAVSGSEMSCSDFSTPQDAVTGSREHGVSGVEKSRPEVLWRGSPRGCPSTIGALPVLRRIRAGFFVGGEGVDLGLGFSESLEPFLLVHGDATLLWFELTEQEVCSQLLEAQTSDIRC